MWLNARNIGTRARAWARAWQQVSVWKCQQPKAWTTAPASTPLASPAAVAVAGYKTQKLTRLDQMMDENEVIHLQAIERSDKGSTFSRRMRKDELIPAVVMAFNSNRRELLLLKKNEIEALVRKFQSEFLRTKRFHLHVHGGQACEKWAIGKDESGEAHIVPAILREIDFHPLRKETLNINLQHCPSHSEIRIKLPFQFVGSSVCPGFKRGGFLYRILDYVECLCDTEDIPPYVELDISNVNIGKSIRTSDITFPPGVRKVLTRDTDVLFKMIQKN